ncbi:MAG: CDP-alcohol phosphatidyltransferase family protein [Candidatus Babeliales bacterium]|nr:CDP-alcohol phosphatidyltransferase family protein [Candidatus Babeliales bacterium]
MAKLNFNFFKKLPDREKKITISTMLTLLRIFLVPFIVLSMIFFYWGTACVLFCIAAASDVADGYLARILDEKTFLGACLDPIADKILVLSCFFTLAFVQSPLFSIPLWFVLLVLLKELVLVIGALILYRLKGHIEIHPTLLGKSTTVVQMGFIMWLFACYFFTWIPVKTYYSMLGIVILLVFASLMHYITIGIKQLKR